MNGRRLRRGLAAGATLGLDEHQPLAALPLERLAHGDSAGVVVDVGPAQPKGLSLLEAERQRH